MFLFKLLLLAHLASAAGAGSPQPEIDAAFGLILSTQAGQAICTHILGADPAALEAHLGVSAQAARVLAADCRPVAVPDWLYATDPSDIRKLTVRNGLGRKYQIVKTTTVYPIESWTDNFTNTTVILTQEIPVATSRLVQVLAHEMAVYFDSKANPAQADAQKLPQLRNLGLKPGSGMDPLIALSDPLTAHTLTFVRALQIERLILYELVNRGAIPPVLDGQDPYLAYLLSPRCTKVCLEHLIVNMREDYLPLSLPLVAFAPSFRAKALAELPRLKLHWTSAQWAAAQSSLFQLPVEFLKDQTRGNSIANLQHLFLPKRDQASYDSVSAFLSYDLWPLEYQTLDNAVLGSGQPLLEFMKRPLLSGYNIMLSSGPRVRVRTGNIE
jgi:hypothetical protein